jgi:NAD(P)H dehydrogenase (quinone)
MNILIITAHPSTDGFSHKLAAQYAKSARANKHKVTQLNLYTAQPQLPYVNYQSYPEWQTDDEVRKFYQQKISKADKLVIIHPIWWGGPPAILKNFYDQVLTPGFAYKYGPRRFVPAKLNVLPHGLLTNKKVELFITYDAYRKLYFFIATPFSLIYRFFIFGFCGIWSVRIIHHSRTKFASDSRRQSWLNRTARVASK